MATTHELTMPIPSTASPSQYSLAYPTPNLSQPQTQQISPPTTTPSPTSPRTQVRKPKNPLYMPAVLRPTDPPKRALRATGPLTPPRSQEGSFDDLVERGRRDSRAGSAKGLGSIEEAGWRLGNIEALEVSARGLGKVTGIPTREHWKPDTHSSHCDYTPPPPPSNTPLTSQPLSSSPTSLTSDACTRPFSYFHRRHHCRRCGQIFCSAHSSHLIPLDQDANYHPRGTRVRACESCYMDYGRWAMTRSRRASEIGEEGEGERFEEPPTPTVSCRGGRLGFLGGRENVEGAQPKSMGQSVPRDWNWSTF